MRPKSGALLLYVSTTTESILLSLPDRGGSEEIQAENHACSQVPHKTRNPYQHLTAVGLLDVPRGVWLCLKPDHHYNMQRYDARKRCRKRCPNDAQSDAERSSSRPAAHLSPEQHLPLFMLWFTTLQQNHAAAPCNSTPAQL